MAQANPRVPPPPLPQLGFVIFFPDNCKCPTVGSVNMYKNPTVGTVGLRKVCKCPTYVTRKKVHFLRNKLSYYLSIIYLIIYLIRCFGVKYRRLFLWVVLYFANNCCREMLPDCEKWLNGAFSASLGHFRPFHVNIYLDFFKTVPLGRRVWAGVSRALFCRSETTSK